MKWLNSDVQDKGDKVPNSVILSAFLNRLVEKEKLEKYNDLPDIRRFSCRLEIQKYVLIAKTYFGLNVDYSYILHKHGPYSFQLSLDYYNNLDKATPDDSSTLGAFQEDDFLRYIDNMSDEDLEIASTFMHTSIMHNDEQSHISHVKRIKSSFSEESIDRIYKEKIVPMSKRIISI